MIGLAVRNSQISLDFLIYYLITGFDLDLDTLAHGNRQESQGFFPIDSPRSRSPNLFSCPIYFEKFAGKLLDPRVGGIEPSS